MELKGVYTALVTPFSKGEVDYAKLKEIVKAQVEAGIDGIVPVGTTGECPTLSVDEHLKVIETAISVANGRCKIMAGTGANSTAEAIELTREAKKAGADCSLQVAPYYNKPTQEGLYRHFAAIADECKLPIVIYNVPGRTGVTVAPETIARLAKNSNVLGVKEAGGHADRVSDILELCKIDILSGDDGLTLPMMVLGAKGVISVASNIVPATMKKLVDAMAQGKLEEALKIHNANYRLFKELFIESNPIPIKAAMAMAGMIEEEYRLPLCPMAEKNRQTLKATLKRLGII